MRVAAVEMYREADRVTTTEDWSDARAALAGGRWGDAAERFSALAAATDDPEAHEGLAQAAWWLDDADTALDAREAAYRAFRAAGRDQGAAGAAATLGYDSMLFGRGVTVGRGWLARASDLLVDLGDSRGAGWLEVRRAEVALNVDHDAGAALLSARRAQDVGRAIDDDDLVIVGQALAGLSQVRLGAVGDGMTLLESSAAAATAGDVADLMWVGKICCWLISACQLTRDLVGASAWCARVEEICERRDLTPLFAVCQTQYAAVLLAGGHAEEAESTLVDVVTRLGRSHRVSRRDAVAQLGELRRRQGRLAEAEDLLRQAGDQPAAVTSLAQLRLDGEDPERARTLTLELLRLLPADQPVERVDALAVAVAACVATGDLASARHAADELRSISQRLDTPAMVAHAEAAAARLAELDTDAPLAAVDRWTDAVRHFRVAGLAFDESDARLRLAVALRRTGDEAAAEDHERQAWSTLAPLVAGPHREPGSPLTQRQGQVLRLLAQGLSNHEIAEQLHLSEHTVHRHLANIYTTIGVGSRAAAAAYAVGHGLG